MKPEFMETWATLMNWERQDAVRDFVIILAFAIVLLLWLVLVLGICLIYKFQIL